MSVSRESAITAVNLCKEYPVSRGLGDWLTRPWRHRGCVRALEDVSFRIDVGQVAGVVGLNGAGKTTLLKILCNLLLPTSGHVSVFGHDLKGSSEAVRACVGFVPSDERSFFWRISARANLEFFASLYHVPPRTARRRIDALLDTFGLTGKDGGHFRDYSSGMRKRLAIIRALVHEPRILVLDEPTNSLDVRWDRHLRDYVRDWTRGERGRAVVWSTHRMEEITDLCDRVLHLEHARLGVIDDPRLAVEVACAREQDAGSPAIAFETNATERVVNATERIATTGEDRLKRRYVP